MLYTATLGWAVVVAYVLPFLHSCWGWSLLQVVTITWLPPP
jgi:hypothetical protein